MILEKIHFESQNLLLKGEASEAGIRRLPRKSGLFRGFSHREGGKSMKGEGVGSQVSGLRLQPLVFPQAQENDSQIGPEGKLKGVGS